MAKRKPKSSSLVPTLEEYDRLLADASRLIAHARTAAARVVNGVLTATYYELGRRIVEHEQGGQVRAGYGEEIIKRLSKDLTAKHGRGFSRRNLEQMRVFYLEWQFCQTVSGRIELRAMLPAEEKAQTLSALFGTIVTADFFPLPWSHYVRLMTVPDRTARRFYEDEAIRGGWSFRQLDRQIATQFYERLSGSKRKAELLAKAHVALPDDSPTASELVRDPYLLEFLDLADEYGESDLEDAILRHLEQFLLELGRGFTFVARQQKLRIDAQWYKLDLLLFHRRLRCLVVADLKLGAFCHADAGQMNMYLNYAREHLMEPGENDPIGLILCSEKSDTVVKYAMGGINAQVFAAKYLTVLPPEDELRAEVERTKRALTGRMPPSVGE